MVDQVWFDFWTKKKTFLFIQCGWKKKRYSPLRQPQYSRMHPHSFLTTALIILNIFLWTGTFIPWIKFKDGQNPRSRWKFDGSRKVKSRHRTLPTSRMLLRLFGGMMSVGVTVIMASRVWCGFSRKLLSCLQWEGTFKMQVCMVAPWH